MILYYIVYPIMWIVGRMPYSWHKRLARFLYLVLYRVFKYRVPVVRDNLQNAFKDKSMDEIITIEKKFYRHLADVFVESMSMNSITIENARKRIEFINDSQIEEYTQGRSWISAMAHYGSWEMTTLWGLYSQHKSVYAVYRPLRSKSFNKIFLQARSRFGVTPIAMEEVGRKLYNAKSAEDAIALALISDQTAPYYTTDCWLEFFGRKTPFFNGIEKLALRFDMPVAFLHIDKFDKGRYKAWFELIYDGKEEVESGEIMRRYVEKLEEMIRKRPELWMWSHRRWKHKYKGAEVNNTNNENSGDE